MKCKKCGHQGEPITAVELFPCGSVQVDQEDPDYRKRIAMDEMTFLLNLQVEKYRALQAIAPKNSACHLAAKVTADETEKHLAFLVELRARPVTA